MEHRDAKGDIKLQVVEGPYMDQLRFTSFRTRTLQCFHS